MPAEVSGSVAVAEPPALAPSRRSRQLALKWPETAYARYLIALAALYVLLYGGILLVSRGMPYLFDNNESFLTLTHASNIVHFGVGQTFGLTDESNSPDPAAHPYVYTHQGNFPRVWALLLYVLGARSIEAQIVITTFTVGAAAVWLMYHYFSRIASPAFAFLACLIFNTDYVLFMQWQVNTFNVWHAFFLFACLLCAHLASTRDRRLWWITAGLHLCLFYFEYAFALFVAITCGVYVLLTNRGARTWLFAWSGQLAGAVVSVGLMLAQLIGYYGLTGLRQDLTLTYVARNAAAQDAQLSAQLQKFLATYHLAFWNTITDSQPLLRFPDSLELFYRYTFLPSTPFLALIVLVLVLSWGCAWLASLDLSRVRLATPKQASGALLVPLFIACYILALALLEFKFAVGKPGLPAQPLSLWRGPAGLVAASALLAILATATAGWQALRVARSARLLALLVVFLGLIAAFIDAEYVLFTQHLRQGFGGDSLSWATQLTSWLPLPVQALALALAVGLGAWSIFDLRMRESTWLRCTTPQLLRYLLAGLLAFGIVFRIMPGYVMSGYLVRYVPLAVFLVDVFLAASVFHVLVFARDRIPKLPISPAGFGPMPVAFGRITAGISLALVGLLCVVWLKTQIFYIATLPPTAMAGLESLRQPLYKGASFVMNTTAGPVADLTRQWAYYDPRLIEVSSAPDVARTTSTSSFYLWLADKDVNPSYQHPDYFLCFYPPNIETLVKRQSDPAFNDCLRTPLVRTAAQAGALIASDASQPGVWAIVDLRRLGGS